MVGGFIVFFLLSMSSVRYLILVRWICCMHACMYGHSRYVTLFKDVGDVVRMYASLDAYCEDSKCYIPLGIF